VPRPLVGRARPAGRDGAGRRAAAGLGLPARRPGHGRRVPGLRRRRPPAAPRAAAPALARAGGARAARAEPAPGPAPPRGRRASGPVRHLPRPRRRPARQRHRPGRGGRRSPDPRRGHVKFGIFYEHQLPRPWDEDAEHRLLKDALDQIQLADELGFDYVWEVEHHFLEEYSHSSAPEVFLAAASQRTSRIRLGHGIVQLPFNFNHTARVAERIATLDLVSDGRVEFGTGEASSEAELGGFRIERAEKRAQWEEALDIVTRMFVETPFAGHESDNFSVPVRNVVPKPLQKPHPPLWVACSRRETIHLAATKGI